MDSITIFYFSLGAIVGFLLAISILLNKILNVLRRMANGGEDTGNPNKMKFGGLRFK